MKRYNIPALVFIMLALIACKNRDVNEGEAFRPRELHDNFNGAVFTKVTVDGIDYLIMERDNNNPHEGFGFMAFRANKLMSRLDTTLAYLKTVNEMQTRIYAKINNIPLETARKEADNLLGEFLSNDASELAELAKEELTSTINKP